MYIVQKKFEEKICTKSSISVFIVGQKIDNIFFLLIESEHLIFFTEVAENLDGS